MKEDSRETVLQERTTIVCVHCLLQPHSALKGFGGRGIPRARRKTVNGLVRPSSKGHALEMTANARVPRDLRKLVLAATMMVTVVAGWGEVRLLFNTGRRVGDCNGHAVCSCCSCAAVFLLIV